MAVSLFSSLSTLVTFPPPFFLFANTNFISSFFTLFFRFLTFTPSLRQTAYACKTFHRKFFLLVMYKHKYKHSNLRQIYHKILFTNIKYIQKSLFYTYRKYRQHKTWYTDKYDYKVKSGILSICQAILSNEFKVKKPNTTSEEFSIFYQIYTLQCSNIHILCRVVTFGL